MGELHKWNCNPGVFINEATVKVGKSEEGLNVFDLLGLRPVLDNLDFILCHREALGG